MFSQTHGIPEELYQKIRQQNLDTCWTRLERKAEVRYLFKDTVVYPFLNPLRRSSYLDQTWIDTVSIHIYFEDNWSEEKVVNQSQRNKAIITPLFHRFKLHYDSLQWRDIMFNEEMFEENKVAHLQGCRFFNEAERKLAKLIIRLPNSIKNGYGSFVTLYYKGHYLPIEDISDQRVALHLAYISKEILGNPTTFSGMPRYE